MKKDISICSWNIQGLMANGCSSKLEIDYIKKELEFFDIIGLLEIHGNEDTVVNFKGYDSHTITRKRLKNAKKDHGGITVLIRNEIRNKVKIINSKQLPVDAIWLKIPYHLFPNFHEDIYLCFAYFSPENSTYTKRTQLDVFELIKIEIAHFSQAGKVILMGDLNARSGDGIDFDPDNFVTHTTDGQKFVDKDINIKLYKRNSQDSNAIIRSYGRSLLQLCIECDMSIVNGRFLGDNSGKFTCHERQGSSLVDYAVVDLDIFHMIDYFHVHNFYADISDHCPISLHLSAEIPVIKQQNLNQNIMKQFYGYNWDSDSSYAFKSALNSIESQNKIKHIMEIDLKNTSVEELTNDFNEIIYTAANLSLNHKKRLKKKKKKSKWFNNECYIMKKNLNYWCRKFNDNPFNNDTREKLFYWKKSTQK